MNGYHYNLKHIDTLTARQRELKRNIATFGANILHHMSNPVIPIFFGGKFDIIFHDTLTIKPY